MTQQKPVPIPLSSEIASRGIRTDADFAAVFTALIADTLSGAVNPNVTNAACNSAGKVLKMFELRQKHGSPKGGPLKLIDTTPQPTDGVRQAALAKLTPEERAALGVE